MTQIVLSNRSIIYSTPELSEVSGNGGDRINKKIQQALKRLIQVPGAEGILQEELEKGKTGKRKSGGSSTESTPTKKKRVGGKKVKEEEEVDELESEDQEN